MLNEIKHISDAALVTCYQLDTAQYHLRREYQLWDCLDQTGLVACLWGIVWIVN